MAELTIAASSKPERHLRCLKKTKRAVWQACTARGFQLEQIAVKPADSDLQYEVTFLKIHDLRDLNREIRNPIAVAIRLDDRLVGFLFVPKLAFAT